MVNRTASSETDSKSPQKQSRNPSRQPWNYDNLRNLIFLKTTSNLNSVALSAYSIHHSNKLIWPSLINNLVIVFNSTTIRCPIQEYEVQYRRFVTDSTITCLIPCSISWISKYLFLISTNILYWISKESELYSMITRFSNFDNFIYNVPYLKHYNCLQFQQVPFLFPSLETQVINSFQCNQCKLPCFAINYPVRNISKLLYGHELGNLVCILTQSLSIKPIKTEFSDFLPNKFLMPLFTQNCQLSHEDYMMGQSWDILHVI